ncbi:MAG: isoprenyl transferase [Gammaproteobacteria bacterium]|nr:isoprenyl transferase [Gammaproteobacteria bacterium]
MTNYQEAEIQDLVLSGQLPRHVAIIMDGNGRWARKRNLPRFAGHRFGLESVRKIVSECAKRNVEVLTLFAFSSENWKRPQKEVGVLMDLFMTALKQEVKKLHKNNVRLKIVGGREAFKPKLQALIQDAEDFTQENTGLTLVIAANYGGRWDIMQAMKRMMEDVMSEQRSMDSLGVGDLDQYMSLSELPEPDLFIRTGGEQRISNFLLWQLAYTELYFTETLWPDFDESELAKAIDSFSSRQRRFGRTGEQVEQVAGA